MMVPRGAFEGALKRIDELLREADNKDTRIEDLEEVLEDIRLEYARAFDRERQAVAAIGIIVERALAGKETNDRR